MSEKNLSTQNNMEQLTSYREERAKLLEFIRDGKTEEQARASGLFSNGLIESVYCTVRPWKLPDAVVALNSPIEPKLTERQQQVLALAEEKLTQNEIAKRLRCSQSTVAHALKQAGEAMRQVRPSGGSYQTRMHLFVHGMELWDSVKKLNLNSSEFERGIQEAIQMGASEVTLTHLSYTPQQLDKLIMDIILATNGKCVVIADCYPTDVAGCTHVAYFLSDCIRTLDLDAEKREPGCDIPMRCPITYLNTWIQYLQVPLTTNDARVVKWFELWRGFYDRESN